ncbi:MAG: TolC family protein [Lawsonibacter sp.]
MLNRKSAGVLLAAAVALTLCGMSVFAADPDEPGQTRVSQDLAVSQQADGTGTADATYAALSEEEQTNGASEEETADASAELTPDPVGTISFPNLDSRVRENNFNLLALEEAIASVEVTDYDKMTEDVRKQINEIANQQWDLTTSIPGLGAVAAASLQQSYDALRDTFDDLKDGKIQEDYAAVTRQLRNAQNQVVMASESLYVALTELEENDQTMDRSLAALDRTIQELELRYSLGQISALTLEQTKAGRTALVSGQQTLEMNIANYKIQLEQMIGAELSGSIQLQPLPQVTEEDLKSMDLEADLTAAKEASYTLFAAKRTLDDAQEDFKDAGKEYNYNEKKYQYVAAQHTWQAAQYTYNAAVQGFENSFRTLYLQVKDDQQVLAAAKTALACEQDNYSAMQLKFEQGAISQNKLLDAADEVSAAQDKVNSAEIDLFSAYNNYRWAVDYGIVN